MRGECPRDAGVTLVEVMVASALLSMVIATSYGFVTQTQTVYKQTTQRSRSNDQAELAINRLDRLIRSGNFLYDPSTESDPVNGIHPGLSLRVYTQANSVQKCVQWRIDGGTLQERSWSPTWPSDGIVTDWWFVAESIVNTPQSPAFALDPSPGFGGRLLVIDLRVDVSSDGSSLAERRLAIEGRNTQYGYDPSVCSNSPPA